jgi:hypothetical protein
METKDMKKSFIKILCVASFVFDVSAMNNTGFAPDAPSMNNRSEESFSPSTGLNIIVPQKGYKKTIWHLEVFKMENGKLVKDDQSFGGKENGAVYRGDSNTIRCDWLGNPNYDNNRSEPQEFMVVMTLQHYGESGQVLGTETIKKKLVMNPAQ